MPASERERVNNWHVGQASLFSLASCRVRAQKAMVPDSSTLAWKIPWMEEPGRLQSMGLEESDTTERLHFHFSLSCIGEGNGNRLQYFCLENPRDGGAWWAAVYGVAQSRTQLMRLSSSSSRIRANGLCSALAPWWKNWCDWKASVNNDSTRWRDESACWSPKQELQEIVYVLEYEL